MAISGPFQRSPGHGSTQPSPRGDAAHLEPPRLRPVCASDVGPYEGLAALDGIVLPERVADELFVEEEAPQVGVSLEADAEHVPYLALEPVGDGPEPRGGGHGELVLLDRDLQPEAVIVRDGIEVVDHVEARS